MNRLALLAAAATLALPGAVFAQTNLSPPAAPSEQQQAAAPAAAPAPDRKDMARHVTARRPVRQAALHVSRDETPQTRALNLLEAKGYGDYRNFRPEGGGFAADVNRGGRTETLMVNPDTDSVTPRG
jgi:hypothetical protein